MSKSGVTGSILQAVGTVLMFVPGPWQIVGAMMVTAGSIQNANYQKRKAIDAYNRSLKDRQMMTITHNGARSRVYGLTSNVDGVLFHGTHGADKRYYTLVVALAGHQIESVEQVFFDDVPVSVNVGNGAVMTAPYARGDNTSTVDRFTPSSVETVAGGRRVTLSRPAIGSVVVTVRVSDGYRTMTVKPTVLSVSGQAVTFAEPAIPGGYLMSQVSVVYAYTDPKSYAYVKVFDGRADQDISGELAARFPGLINSSHRFSGIALLLVDLEYNEDVFPTGLPQIRALIKGCNTIYDPRTGTTGYTDNPALCIRDWALYANGGDCALSEIHEASFIRAANDCDTLHTYTDSTGATSTRHLYSLGYVASLDQSPETHLNEMAEAMAGRWGWAGGQLMVRAGVWHGPVATITEDWLSDQGGRSVVGGPGMEDLVNTYKISIADAGQNYSATELPALQPAALLAADGVELVREIEMGAVTYAPQALHIAGVLLRDQRDGLTFSASFNMRAWVLELFDVVEISIARYGWTQKRFEVLKWSHQPNGAVTITFKETGPSIYQPDGSFAIADQIPNTALPSPFVVPLVTGLAVSSGAAAAQTTADGSVINRIKVVWAPITGAAIASGGGVEISFTDAEEEVEARVTADAGAGQVYIGPVKPGATFFVKARAFNSLVRGEWCAPVTHTVVGETAPPGAPTGDAVGLMFSTRISWTFGTTSAPLAATEVWFSSTNNRAVASRLSHVPSPQTEYIHPGLQPGQGGFYWLRVVDVWGNTSGWFPAGANAGMAASALSDPTSLLDLLQGSIGLDQLAEEVATPLGGLESLANKWVLQVNAGGRVAGIALASDSTGSASAMVMLADKFAFVQPDGSGTPRQVMIIGSVDGTPTLGFDGTVIIDGTILPRSIDTRGLTIRDALGNVILGAGSALSLDYVPDGARNSELEPTLAGKLDKAGDDITGRLTLLVADGIFAGTDLDNGVYFGSGGLVARKGGQTKVAISSNGDAFFAGDLAAAAVTTENLIEGSVSNLETTYISTDIATTITSSQTLNLVSVDIDVVRGECTVWAGASLQAAATTTTGGPVASVNVRVEIVRDGFVIGSMTAVAASSSVEGSGAVRLCSLPPIVDDPGPGLHTYTLRAVVSMSAAGTKSFRYFDRGIAVMETKA